MENNANKSDIDIVSEHVEDKSAAIQISADELAFLRMRNSPLAFIRYAFKLVPQRVKDEYRARYELGLLQRDQDWTAFCETVKPYWFDEYREGFDLTWHQSLALSGVEKSLGGTASQRISIVSGHGIGKSTLLSWLILWFLFVHPQSQVACTSPGAEQMYDVLWKEIKKWIERMPKEIQVLYEWESTHIRMKESPMTWFARAKTSSKENTEALAGVHADWVFIAVDEASGVEEPIFETMEGALTSGNILVFLISNGTRSIGYFYDTHHKDKDRWQTFAFDSEESPRVDKKYVQGIIDKYGIDSVQYAIRVRGQFPDEGIMDDKGYVQLFNEADLHFVPFDPDWKPVGRVKSALDASGEGQDSSEWAVRDRIRSGIMASEKSSTPASMSNISTTLMEKYRIHPRDFVIDAFGKGHQVAQEIALSTQNQKQAWRVTPINTGDPCDYEQDRELYMNIRAMLFYKMMLWARQGGEFMESNRLKEELLSIRFRRTVTGRIQIMDKVSMKKLGFNSPNMADALSMTFLFDDRAAESEFERERRESDEKDFDPHTTMD